MLGHRQRMLLHNMVRQLSFTMLFQNGMLTLMFLIMMEEAPCIGNQQFAAQPFFLLKWMFSLFYLLHSALQWSPHFVSWYADKFFVEYVSFGIFFCWFMMSSFSSSKLQVSLVCSLKTEHEPKNVFGRVLVNTPSRKLVPISPSWKWQVGFLSLIVLN